jgi:peptidoglycan hydrolase-like protein with peptidoglycan-binding domain
MELQQRLRNISKVHKDVPSVIPDGIFGEETEEAVKAFQRKFGFPETGVVNFELWDKINDESREALFILSDPIQITEIKNEDLPLVLGQIGREVQTLNMMLSRLGELYSNFGFEDIGDEFTDETEREVKKWQKVIGHDITGEVDKLTWNRLSEHYLLPIR